MFANKWKNVKIGRNRIVIILPRIGIAIKLPKISPFSAIEAFCDLFKTYLSKENRQAGKKLLRIFLTGPIEEKTAFRTLRWYIFRGLAMNWREFIFFLKTRDPFLQPTYLSFFGLLNIAKYGQPIKLEEKELRERMIGVFSAVICEDDEHHFRNKNNFCEIAGGGLRAVDYGSETIQMAIIKKRKAVI